eukprot:scaffold11680_cov142-Cylindrotheca_fusiformis.AAC.10
MDDASTSNVRWRDSRFQVSFSLSVFLEMPDEQPRKRGFESNETNNFPTTTMDSFSGFAHDIGICSS